MPRHKQGSKQRPKRPVAVTLTNKEFWHRTSTPSHWYLMSVPAKHESPLVQEELLFYKAVRAARTSLTSVLKSQKDVQHFVNEYVPIVRERSMTSKMLLSVVGQMRHDILTQYDRHSFTLASEASVQMFNVLEAVAHPEQLSILYDLSVDVTHPHSVDLMTAIVLNDRDLCARCLEEWFIALDLSVAIEDFALFDEISTSLWTFAEIALHIDTVMAVMLRTQIVLRLDVIQTLVGELPIWLERKDTPVMAAYLVALVSHKQHFVYDMPARGIWKFACKLMLSVAKHPKFSPINSETAEIRWANPLIPKGSLVLKANSTHSW